MKKTILLGLALPLVFGLTMGITVSMTEMTSAADPCLTCYYDGQYYCSSQPAPKCPQNLPYAYLEYGACTPGGSYNPSCTPIVRGCCNAACFCLVLLEDPPEW